MSDLILTCINMINFLNVNVSMLILQTVYTFSFVLKRIFLTIDTFFTCLSFAFFSLFD